MFTVLVLSVCVSLATAAAPYYDLLNATELFEEYIAVYDKHYADDAEKQARFAIFKANLEDVNRLNEYNNYTRSSEPAAEYGITEFMDLTNEEFSTFYTGLGTNFSAFASQCRVLTDRDIPDVKAPDSHDWREHNAVTKVKQQGRCESCYTFSTTGHLEGQYAIKHQQLVELSEQQIVDCDRRSRGCNRGFMSWAFMSVMQLGGIMREADYPYRARQQQCQFRRDRVAVRVKGCFTYQLRSQEKLKQLLFQTGPISIAVKGNYFQKYTGGVVADSRCAQGQVNHAVLLVGYGTDPRQGPYWLVKNSYSTRFGEQGYFRMQRGEGATSCGMMNEYMATAVIE